MHHRTYLTISLACSVFLGAIAPSGEASESPVLWDIYYRHGVQASEQQRYPDAEELLLSALESLGSERLSDHRDSTIKAIIQLYERQKRTALAEYYTRVLGGESLESSAIATNVIAPAEEDADKLGASGRTMEAIDKYDLLQANCDLGSNLRIAAKLAKLLGSTQQDWKAKEVLKKAIGKHDSSPLIEQQAPIVVLNLGEVLATLADLEDSVPESTALYNRSSDLVMSILGTESPAVTAIKSRMSKHFNALPRPPVSVQPSTTSPKSTSSSEQKINPAKPLPSLVATPTGTSADEKLQPTSINYASLMSDMQLRLKKVWKSSSDHRIVVAYKIDQTGQPFGFKIEISSGNKFADADAIRAIKDAAPYRMVPDDSGIEELECEASFSRDAVLPIVSKQHADWQSPARKISIYLNYTIKGGAVDPPGYDFGKYVDGIYQKLQSELVVPTGTQAGCCATVSFLISPDGMISGARIDTSSGEEQFNRSILKTIEHASPFDRLPEHIRESVMMTAKFSIAK